MRLVLLLLVFAMCTPAAAMAHWIVDLDAGALRDSNLNNAEFARDIRGDTALTASVSAGQFIQIGSDYSFTITADAKGEVYHRYSGMNNLSLGTTLGLRRKLGLGAAAPWVRLSVSAARLEFNDGLRDGWLYRAGLTAGKRFAERWELQAGYSFEERTADNARPSGGALPGNVYDLRSRTLALDASYSLSEQTLIFAGYSRRDGDVVSSSERNAKIFRGSTALAADPVFGPNVFAYTLGAISHALSVGVSQAISPRASLNLSYQRQITHGDGDNNYFKNLFTASYSHSF